MFTQGGHHRLRMKFKYIQVYFLNVFKYNSSIFRDRGSKANSFQFRDLRWPDYIFSYTFLLFASQILFKYIQVYFSKNGIFKYLFQVYLPFKYEKYIQVYSSIGGHPVTCYITLLKQDGQDILQENIKRNMKK